MIRVLHHRVTSFVTSLQKGVQKQSEVFIFLSIHLSLSDLQ